MVFLGVSSDYLSVPEMTKGCYFRAAELAVSSPSVGGHDRLAHEAV
jgi:hypothetical protein